MADISGYLKTIRDGQSGETVRDAIINCMRDINEDGQVKKASLVITKPDNVTYKPGKGKAFSSVTVNITGGESDPNKTIKYETLTVTELTENGTYPTEEQPDTYYDKVEVAIDWDKVSHPSNLGEEAEMTTYETDENGNKYWDAALAGFDYVKRIWIPNSIASGLPGGDYPGANTTGPFKVDFYDMLPQLGTPHKIETVTVAKNGDAGALYDKAYPTVGGKFLKWDPDVSKVTKDMVTYARYSSKGSYDPQEIGKSWDLIMAMDPEELLGKWNYLDVVGEDGRSRVGGFGRYFKLSTVSYNPDGSDPISLTIEDPTVKFTIRMQCVALGENGSKTTWLAMDPLPPAWIADGQTGGINAQGMAANNLGIDDWPVSWTQDILSKIIAKALPGAIQNHLKDVIKPTYGVSQYNPLDIVPPQLRLKDSGGKVWLPSVGEIGALFSDYTAEYGFPSGEQSAVNYSDIWTPDFLTGSVYTEPVVYTRSYYLGVKGTGTSDYIWGMGSYDTRNKTVWASDLPTFFTHSQNGSGAYIGFCLG